MFAGLNEATAVTVLWNLVNPVTLLFMMAGTIGGIVFGAIPGLTGAMLIVLSLPFTYYMDPVNALSYLIAVYVGAISGGLITATLFRMPGTPSNVITTLDGYPMAMKGQAGRALSIGITASFVGGCLAFVFLFAFTGPLAMLATRFGPFELFSIVLMALVLIATISRGSTVLGIISGFLGMLISMPGYDGSSGQQRLTFGFEELADGLDLFPVLIGMFVISEVFAGIQRPSFHQSGLSLAGQRLTMSFSELRGNVGNFMRSGIMGTWIGVLPGVGANIASIIAYSTERNLSKNPERFGKGEPAGIVASETANNATVGGSLIPLFALGIPGSAVEAMLLGAFTIHGIIPGPLLFTRDASLVYTLMGGYLIANVMMFLVMIATTRYVMKLVNVPKQVLLPVIAICCVLGIFALNNRFFDIYVALGFGVVGYLFTLARIPLAPFIIGFILAPIAEENLRSGLTSYGSILPMFTRPVSLAFMLISLLMLVVPPFLQRRRDVKRMKI